MLAGQQGNLLSDQIFQKLAKIEFLTKKTEKS